MLQYSVPGLLPNYVYPITVLDTYLICKNCNIGVTVPPQKMTVTSTITMVADSINLLASDDVLRIARA